jgi:hypothetical protein
MHRQMLIIAWSLRLLYDHERTIGAHEHIGASAIAVARRLSVSSMYE